MYLLTLSVIMNYCGYKETYMPMIINVAINFLGF